MKQRVIFQASFGRRTFASEDHSRTFKNKIIQRRTFTSEGHRTFTLVKVATTLQSAFSLEGKLLHIDIHHGTTNLPKHLNVNKTAEKNKLR